MSITISLCRGCGCRRLAALFHAPGGQTGLHAGSTCNKCRVRQRETTGLSASISASAQHSSSVQLRSTSPNGPNLLSLCSARLQLLLAGALTFRRRGSPWVWAFPDQQVLARQVSTLAVYHFEAQAQTAQTYSHSALPGWSCCWPGPPTSRTRGVAFGRFRVGACGAEGSSPGGRLMGCLVTGRVFAEFLGCSVTVRGWLRQLQAQARTRLQQSHACSTSPDEETRSSSGHDWQPVEQVAKPCTQDLARLGVGCYDLWEVLCARITEVLSLRASDFHWRAKCVTICALKGQPQAGCTCL